MIKNMELATTATLSLTTPAIGVTALTSWNKNLFLTPPLELKPKLSLTKKAVCTAA